MAPGTISSALRHPVVAGRLGVLPDFLVIGAQKCGTTTLYDYLVQHPRVRPAREKEVHFFDESRRFGSRQRRWYRSQFPPTRPHRGGRDWLTGEATPFYLFHPLVPERISAVVPDARLIVSLRDPASRAYSHYQHMRLRGHEPLSFADALAAEPERLGDVSARLAATSDFDASIPVRLHSYFARGRYDEQLARWLDVFPREQILVVEAEELFGHTQQVMATVFEFLGINPGVELAVRHLNQSVDVADDDRPVIEELRERYVPSVRRLVDLVGRDFSWS